MKTKREYLAILKAEHFAKKVWFKKFQNARDPELEAALVELGDPDLIAYYLEGVDTACPLVFDNIVLSTKHLTLMLAHAVVTVQGRWVPFEEFALSEEGAKVPFRAERMAQYAALALKGPWPAAELIILADPAAEALYYDYVLKQR